MTYGGGLHLCFHSTAQTHLPVDIDTSNTEPIVNINMHFSRVILASTAVSFAAAAAFSYPLANGFPKLNATVMQQVCNLAGGTLPSGALPVA